VMVPAVLVLFVFFEITRFYYGPLTRLAQALFWGETIARSTLTEAASYKKAW
jgi:hypothetical protein